MIKNLIVFGTRPEAIKMAPLVKAFQKEMGIFETRQCVNNKLQFVMKLFQIMTWI